MLVADVLVRSGIVVQVEGGGEKREKRETIKRVETRKVMKEEEKKRQENIKGGRRE